jgi:SAM-dependent methyltransferase
VTGGFDRVARAYRWLEYAAFGRLLERARFVHLGVVAGRSRVLLLGDGDGRFLRALLGASPHARIRSIDASRRMLALAADRLAAGDRGRVVFECRDALTAEYPTGAYDAVVTQFFLDCFTPGEIEALVPRVAGALAPGGVWLFADFAVPRSGAARWYAGVVVAGLYGFFRRTAGIAARALPPSETVIKAAGLAADRSAAFRGGLVRSVVYRR